MTLTFLFSLGQRIFRLSQPVQPVQVQNVVQLTSAANQQTYSGLQIQQQQYQQQYQQLPQQQPTVQYDKEKQMSFKFVSKG